MFQNQLPLFGKPDIHNVNIVDIKSGPFKMRLLYSISAISLIKLPDIKILPAIKQIKAAARPAHTDENRMYARVVRSDVK